MQNIIRQFGKRAAQAQRINISQASRSLIAAQQFNFASGKRLTYFLNK
jgi:hypothetical protein